MAGPKPQGPMGSGKAWTASAPCRGAGPLGKQVWPAGLPPGQRVGRCSRPRAGVHRVISCGGGWGHVAFALAGPSSSQPGSLIRGLPAPSPTRTGTEAGSRLPFPGRGVLHEFPLPPRGPLGSLPCGARARLPRPAFLCPRLPMARPHSSPRVRLQRLASFLQGLFFCRRDI